MRILHIGKYFEPDFGGIETAIRNLSRVALDKSHSVTVVCFQKKAKSYHPVEQKGLRVRRLKTAMELRSQPISSDAYSVLLEETRTADVIHLHSPNPFLEAVFFLLPVKRHTKLIYHFHCDVYRQRWLKKAYWPLRKKLMNKSDVIVVSSQKLISTAIASGAEQKKIKVIPFNVSVPENLQFSEGKYAIFIGRLVYYKGLDILIDVFLKTQYPLKIVGDGPLFSSLKKRLEQVRPHKIELLGKVSEEEKKELLLNSRFGVLPSTSVAETFGIFSLECMSYKKPMITTKLNTATDEVNVHGETGFVVESKNKNSLKKSIELLFSDSDLVNKLGEQAQDRVRSHYSDATAWSSYQEIYPSI